MYTGIRQGRAIRITDGDEDLPIYSHIFSHSNTFEWGHLGSGPAQLALAILYQHTGNKTLALTYHQQFKQQVISRLPVEGWTLTKQEVNDWIQANVPQQD